MEGSISARHRGWPPLSHGDASTEGSRWRHVAARVLGKSSKNMQARTQNKQNPWCNYTTQQLPLLTFFRILCIKTACFRLSYQVCPHWASHQCYSSPTNWILFCRQIIKMIFFHSSVTILNITLVCLNFFAAFFFFVVVTKQIA